MSDATTLAVAIKRLLALYMLGLPKAQLDELTDAVDRLAALAALTEPDGRQFVAGTRWAVEVGASKRNDQVESAMSDATALAEEIKRLASDCAEAINRFGLASFRLGLDGKQPTPENCPEVHAAHEAVRHLAALAAAPAAQPVALTEEDVDVALRYVKMMHGRIDAGPLLRRLQQIAASPAEPTQEPGDAFCDAHCTWADHQPGCPRAEPTQRPLTGWISVDERKPPKFEEVLIAFRDMPLPATGQYTASPHDTWGWSPEESGPITHWMPLPEHPTAPASPQQGEQEGRTQERKPLTDEQIKDLYVAKHWYEMGDFTWGAASVVVRAVEQLHGIHPSTQGGEG